MFRCTPRSPVSSSPQWRDWLKHVGLLLSPSLKWLVYNFHSVLCTPVFAKPFWPDLLKVQCGIALNFLTCPSPSKHGGEGPRRLASCHGKEVLSLPLKSFVMLVFVLLLEVTTLFRKELYIARIALGSYRLVIVQVPCFRASVQTLALWCPCESGRRQHLTPSCCFYRKVAME